MNAKPIKFELKQNEGFKGSLLKSRLLLNPSPEKPGIEVVRNLKAFEPGSPPIQIELNQLKELLPEMFLINETMGGTIYNNGTKQNFYG